MTNDVTFLSFLGRHRTIYLFIHFEDIKRKLFTGSHNCTNLLFIHNHDLKIKKYQRIAKAGLLPGYADALLSRRWLQVGCNTA